MRFLAARGVVTFAIFSVLAVSGCNDYGNTFTYNSGATLQVVSPANATVCVAGSGATCPDLTVTITGVGFVKQTYATFDQQKIATTQVTDSAGNVLYLTATIPAADLTKVGTYFIQTVNPNVNGSGANGLSVDTLTFTVNPTPNPIPAISAISPTSTPACGTSCTSVSVPVTITGSNFLASSSTTGVSTVNWNAGATQTTFSTANGNPANLTISATSIQLNLPGSLLANAGTAMVTVTNPPLTQTCPTGITCNGNGGGGTSPCPLVSGSTTVTVCTFTITDPSTNSTNSAAIQEETPAVSADGRYIAYTGSQSGHTQIFARDTCQGAQGSCQQRTILVSSTTEGVPAADDSHAPSMSSDGRYVAFSSAASNLTDDVAASTSTSGRQVYLRDTCFGASGSCTPATQLISTDPNGTLVGTEAILPSISASGRFVAFLSVTPSHASSAARGAVAKPTAGSPNSGVRQIFVRDTCLGAQNCTPSTNRISLQPGDGTDSSTKPAGPAISGGADHVGLAGANTTTLFTRSVAVDDNVFLAITKSQP